ncbi:S26 family signal peptidase [Actinoplanes sp. NPDC049118]|uniref:S26 family signal peptidase n=1 Tax=Actinoplanes sp. NPDC049118 TaxID=3155769 RepID=UPI003409D1D2
MTTALLPTPPAPTGVGEPDTGTVDQQAPASRPGLSLRWSMPLLRLVAVGLLAAGAAIVAWTILPLAWGWSSAVIVSGSMSPQVHRGDVVVTSPPAADWRPAVGQVVTVPDQTHPGQTVTHRVVGFDEQGRLMTRGDANGSDDAFRTAPEQVRGIARLLVPRIGLATLLLREGHPALFVAQSAAVLGVLALALRLPVLPLRPLAAMRRRAA